MNTPEQMVKIIKAYNEGKTIESKGSYDKEWTKLEYPNFSFSLHTYRIKPEPKLRPYTFEELSEEVVKHSPYLKWGSEIVSIGGFTNKGVGIVKPRGMTNVDYGVLCYMTWLDTGEPCGIYEEEI